MGEDLVEVSTDPGYAFEATDVEGAPRVTDEGVVVSRELGELMRTSARAIGIRLHFSKVKEGDAE